MKRVVDRIIIEQLQKQILSLQQHHQPTDKTPTNMGLGAIESAFADNVFPKAAVHELLSFSSEDAACTSAFMSVIISQLMQQGGFCLWISTVPRRSVFPPALKTFGIEPDRVLFIDMPKEKDTLWALEESLKCAALTAVVGEISELSFNDSRRLQLAVERSRVTGFIHRFRPKNQNAVACVSRWKITHLASSMPDQLPGLGFPEWNVELLKARGGKPGQWQVQYSPGGLRYTDKTPSTESYKRYAG